MSIRKPSKPAVEAVPIPFGFALSDLAESDRIRDEVGQLRKRDKKYCRAWGIVWNRMLSRVKKAERRKATAWIGERNGYHEQTVYLYIRLDSIWNTCMAEAKAQKIDPDTLNVQQFRALVSKKRATAKTAEAQPVGNNPSDSPDADPSMPEDAEAMSMMERFGEMYPIWQRLGKVEIKRGKIGEAVAVIVGALPVLVIPE